MFKELARRRLKLEGIEKWPKIKNEITQAIQFLESSDLDEVARVMELNLIRANELALIASACRDISVEHIEFCRLIDITKECQAIIGSDKENRDEALYIVENTYLKPVFSAISVIGNSMYLLNGDMEQTPKANIEESLKELDKIDKAFEAFILDEEFESIIDGNPEYKELFNTRDNLLTMRLANVKRQLMIKLDEAEEATNENSYIL